MPDEECHKTSLIPHDTINHIREEPCIQEDSWCCSQYKRKNLEAFLMVMVYLFFSLCTLLANPLSYCYFGWMTQRSTQITGGVRQLEFAIKKLKKEDTCHDINVYISPAAIWLYHMYTCSSMLRCWQHSFCCRLVHKTTVNQEIFK